MSCMRCCVYELPWQVHMCFYAEKENCDCLVDLLPCLSCQGSEHTLVAGRILHSIAIDCRIKTVTATSSVKLDLKALAHPQRLPMQNHKNMRVLIASTDSIIKGVYQGNQRSMMITNLM